MATVGLENYKRHISGRFNKELEDIRQQVLAMGGLVEQQVIDSVAALTQSNQALAEDVIRRDHKVNAMEVAIDEECSRILARRQPAAGDLRLIIATFKAITDLERIGDEATRIARVACELIGTEMLQKPLREIDLMARVVADILHRALDAFARMDSDTALAITRMDERVNRDYRALIRQCTSIMSQDSQAIEKVLDLIWAVRALERVGDHSQNIAELIVFFVHGKDIRHELPDEDGAAEESRDTT